MRQLIEALEEYLPNFERIIIGGMKSGLID